MSIFSRGKMLHASDCGRAFLSDESQLFIRMRYMRAACCGARMSEMPQGSVGNQQGRATESELFQDSDAGIAHHFLGLVRAVAWARADFRVIAAGVRAFVVDRAQPALAIQVQAVIVAHALQGEDAGLLVEALDDAFFLQALGDVLRIVTLLELVDNAYTAQFLYLGFQS